MTGNPGFSPADPLRQLHAQRHQAVKGQRIQAVCRRRGLQTVGKHPDQAQCAQNTEHRNHPKRNAKGRLPSPPGDGALPGPYPPGAEGPPALPLEEGAPELEKYLLVHRFSLLNFTVKTLPLPYTLWTLISPFRMSTTRFTSARPKPLPWVAWEVSP